MPIALGLGLGLPLVLGGGPGPEPVVVVWDPASATANVSLSNDDLTATIAGDAAGVRTVQHHVASKAVVSIRLDTALDYQDVAVGFAPVDWVPVAYPGFDDTSIAIYPYAGGVNVGCNAVRTVLAMVWDQGETMQAAIDQVAKRLWVRVEKSGGWTHWNDNPAADPDAGTGGIDVSAVDTSDLYVFAGGSPYDLTHVFTLV